MILLSLHEKQKLLRLLKGQSPIVPGRTCGSESSDPLKRFRGKLLQAFFQDQQCVVRKVNGQKQAERCCQYPQNESDLLRILDGHNFPPRESEPKERWGGFPIRPGGGELQELPDRGGAGFGTLSPIRRTLESRSDTSSTLVVRELEFETRRRLVAQKG
jgi:hypothetical protein